MKQVKAIEEGFNDGARRRPGDVFMVDTKATATWFKDVPKAKEPKGDAKSQPKGDK